MLGRKGEIELTPRLNNIVGQARLNDKSGRSVTLLQKRGKKNKHLNSQNICQKATDQYLHDSPLFIREGTSRSERGELFERKHLRHGKNVRYSQNTDDGSLRSISEVLK